MNKEEKEVVNMIKTGLEVSVECQIIEQIHLNRKEAQTVLNLIKKQSKEIEELNKSDTSKEQSSMNYYNLYKELVDKIKAKIEVLEKLQKEFPKNDEIRIKIIAYKELLEEEGE